MGTTQDAFWANADVSQKVNSAISSEYLPKGKFRVKLTSIKSLVNHGTKGRTGKIFSVSILESDNDSVKPGEEYQIAYWQHLYGANKIRGMLKDSMGLSDEDLADKETLGNMTDDEESPLLGLTTRVRGYTKDGKDFVNYVWSLFEELQEA